MVLKLFLKLIISFLFSVVTFIPLDIHAMPPAFPSDPFSDQSYEIIKNYLNINGKLPNFYLESIQTTIESEFQLQRHQIKVDGFPDVVLVFKLPKNMNQKLPAVVLFSGFQTGSQSVNLIGNSNNMVFVGFEYPWPIDLSKGSSVWDWKRMEVIPVLMTVALVWLYQQNFIDAEKINVVSVSFGTLFYPLALRLLQDFGFSIRTSVFGYGGVEISEVIGNELQKSLGQTEVLLAKWVIKSQTWFVEPKYHLKHLRGPFLIINGSEDFVFPQASKEELFKSLPEPKKHVLLQGSHIQPDNPELINSFMQEIFKFYLENQSI